MTKEFIETEILSGEGTSRDWYRLSGFTDSELDGEYALYPDGSIVDCEGMDICDSLFSLQTAAVYRAMR